MSDIESIIADIDRLNTNTGEPFYASVWDDTDVREAIKYNAPDVEFTDEMYDDVWWLLKNRLADALIFAGCAVVSDVVAEVVNNYDKED